MNEPRCESNSSAPALQAWTFVKSVDQKHLVTIGLEGFYGLKTMDKSGINPGEWAASLGSDFIQNSAIDNIDFASVHGYPDSWIPRADLEATIKYLSDWVDAHIGDGENVLKKPILFTEVGFPLHSKRQGLYEREILLKMVYDKIYESAKKREAGGGSLIWQLLIEGMEEYSDQFSFVAWNHPSTYELMVQQYCRLQNISRGQANRKLTIGILALVRFLNSNRLVRTQYVKFNAFYREAKFQRWYWIFNPRIPPRTKQRLKKIDKRTKVYSSLYIGA